MNVPPELADAARRWLQWAAEDLALAESAYANDDLAPRGSCMWSHQASEKAIKAMLIAHDIDPPKVHALAPLAARLPEGGHDALTSIDLSVLSRWAIDGRYPDVDQATRSDAAEALSLARLVLEVAEQHLDDVLGPGV